MKNKELAQRIKALRNRKGSSQEELSGKTGLSVRTIQRIENGETEPRGDSLKRIAASFGINSDELVDWTIQEDKGFLISLNLSALSFIIFPLLGIITPLIVWISRKDKIRNINEIAKEILNFQVTWTMAFFIGYVCIVICAAYEINTNPGILITMMPVVFTVIMYLYNLIIIIINSLRINNDKKVVYYPKIRFIRK